MVVVVSLFEEEDEEAKEDGLEQNWDREVKD
jgi:hypothetical protein